ncbi:stalk domain-containing protein [Paenibacillus sp. 2TAB23]|uniref:stalk domain-containing protein n=1 Tax=Paenibacillus sp. 2TAB23 TaxID=3233004 RepID=UPI003F9C7B5D
MLLQKGSTFVPVRFVSELLESTVEYMANHKTVILFEKKIALYISALLTRIYGGFLFLIRHVLETCKNTFGEKQFSYL